MQEAYELGTQYSGSNYRVATPSGDMNIFIVEDKNGKPFDIQIFLGKNGSEAYAWASALAGMIVGAWRLGMTVDDTLDILQDITSGAAPRQLRGDFGLVRSGPEGIYRVLYRYWREKNVSAS